MGIEQDFKVKNGLVVGQTITTAGISVSGNASFTSTGAVKLPAGTEAQRPAGTAGQLRFNSTTNKFECYNGSTWGSIGGSLDWTTVNTTYTATAGQAIMANTSGGSFTITLPSSPTTGAIVVIADAADFFCNRPHRPCS